MKKIIVFCFSIFFCSSLLASGGLDLGLSTSTSEKYAKILQFYPWGKCQWADLYRSNKYYKYDDSRYLNYEKEGTYICKYDKGSDSEPLITITWNNGKKEIIPIVYDNNGLALTLYNGEFYYEDNFNEMK